MWKSNKIRRRVLDIINRKIDEAEQEFELEVEKIQQEANDKINQKENELVERFTNFLN